VAFHVIPEHVEPGRPVGIIFGMKHATPAADVALLTDRRYTAAAADPGDWYLGNILADDGLLQAALSRRGLTSVRVDWADAGVDWSAFGCALFRTTWDYFDRFPQFTAWLDHVERHTRVCNPVPTVRWNMDKHYLADLEARGVPVVPSRFLERGSTTPLIDVLTEAGWDEAVVKPCVSGAARHTYRVNRRTAGEVQPLLTELLAAEAMIVQPFMADIARTGEDTLMVFGGKYSHAVRKVAKAGDFRVQDDFGGTVHPHTPTAEQIALAERAVAACAAVPVYGRVDLVRDNAGRLAIMELELIEPELWLRMHPPSADTFADSVVAFLADRR
jgi:glutathione synthase/RimK-type ligase-like ATP-grasp enzyme